MFFWWPYSTTKVTIYWCPVQIQWQYNGMFTLEITEHIPLSMFCHWLRNEWQSHFVSNCDIKIRTTHVNICMYTYKLWNPMCPKNG